MLSDYRCEIICRGSRVDRRVEEETISAINLICTSSTTCVWHRNMSGFAKAFQPWVQDPELKCRRARTNKEPQPSTATQHTNSTTSKTNKHTRTHASRSQLNNKPPPPPGRAFSQMFATKAKARKNTHALSPSTDEELPVPIGMQSIREKAIRKTQEFLPLTWISIEVTWRQKGLPIIMSLLTFDACHFC